MVKKRREGSEDPFDSFIRDMMDFLRKMDEELSEFFEEDMESEYGGVRPDYKHMGGDGTELEESVDVIELADEVLVVMEIPGARKEDINIRAKGMELIIKVRDLLKRVALPIRVDPSRARATYRNGILEVRIRK